MCIAGIQNARAEDLFGEKAIADSSERIFLFRSLVFVFFCELWV